MNNLDIIDVEYEEVYVLNGRNRFMINFKLLIFDEIEMYCYVLKKYNWNDIFKWKGFIWLWFWIRDVSIDFWDVFFLVIINFGFVLVVVCFFILLYIEVKFSIFGYIKF